MTKHSEVSGHTKILIPVGKIASRELITQALHLLSAFKHPVIVLLQVIEVPGRISTLEPDPYRSEIKSAEEKLAKLSKWLTEQGIEVRTKVAVARNAVEGIITETENEGYMIVFLMKRRGVKGWKRFFNRSMSERVVREANCLVMTAPLEHLKNSQNDE